MNGNPPSSKRRRTLAHSSCSACFHSERPLQTLTPELTDGEAAEAQVSGALIPSPRTTSSRHPSAGAAAGLQRAGQCRGSGDEGRCRRSA
jgi:hypothetical protein